MPKGTIVLADGGVDGPETCTDEGSVLEFALTCSAAPGSDDIPGPEPSLACRVIPIPTPPGVVIFCCACAP